MPDNQDQPGRTIKSVERLFLITDALLELDGARVTELADYLGFTKSSVHSYLSTMLDHGYAVKEGDEYHLGLRFLNVGGHLRERKEAYSLARPVVDALAADTGERAQFIVEENGRGFFLHRTRGERAVDAGTRLGKRIWLHSTGAGKAILAHLSDSRRDAIIDMHGLPQRTPNTITDRGELEAELQQVRERGYAINNEEGTRGLQAVAAPILDPTDRVLGALSVSGPSRRLGQSDYQQELIDTILGSANELELRLSYS